MKAIIEVDVPDFQMGQEVSIYFKDTMMIKGVVQEPSGETKNQHKCNQCKYLSDEKCTIGRKCLHPTKVFHTSTAHWKYPSCKACKLFEKRIEV